jgi:CHAT domain-containing protein
MSSVTRNDLVAAFLLAGQYRIDPASGPGTRWPPSDAVTAAAAALAAGAPGRAGRVLNLGATPAVPGDPGRAVLDHAIVTFDRQWTFGGSGSNLTDDAAAVLAEADRRLPASARQTPLGILAVMLLPELFVARQLTEDERRAGLAALAGRRRRRLDTAERWTGLGPAARSYLALACADLAHREQNAVAAAAATRQALAFADGDAAAQAHLELVRGDWAAEPLRFVESLGLGGPRTAPTGPRDRAAAEEHYARAERLWSAIGSRGGRAAIELRRAHLARTAGLADERDARLARAFGLAGAGGQEALVALSTVHALIDSIADGHRMPPESIDQVREWAHGDGSRSYGRGLLRLLLLRARAWRDDGDFTRAHSTIRLARRLARSDEADLDGASISVDLAAIYGGAGYRRARLARAEAELTSGLQQPDTQPLTTVRWMALAVRAQELFTEAGALADPDAVDAAADRVAQILELPVRPAPDDMAVVAAARAELAASWGRSATLRGWYDGLRHRDQGREGAAQLAFRQALAAADDDLLRCAVLAAIPRLPEALTAALGFASDLPPLNAATLFLRLEEPDLAELALAAADEPGDPPWLIAALRARLHRQRGVPGEQVHHARQAVALFEQRRDRLARDLLRSAASDDPVVAGAYHDLVTGLVAQGADRDALAASDRARGLPFALLNDLAAEPGETRRAARAWLAAQSRWAAACEAAVRPGAGAGPVAVDEAEAAVDEAEQRVARIAPDLLRTRIGPPPEVAAAIAALPEDAVLLAYHHSDRELIGWAATADGRIACTGTIRDPEVIGCTARWQSALARGETDPAAAGVLADRLLAPFADRLAGRRRILVVPHRDLSVVPFQALPWGGGVLGDRYDVSYLPAVSLLRPHPAGSPPPRYGSALIVGDPATDPARGLRRLPGTRGEALAVAELLGAEPPLLDGDATVDLIRKLAPAADVLHLGSHAIVPPGAPNLGHLALAGTDRLTVADLLDLDLSATLVVLSACQTGTGTATLGGDLVGMTRAVLLAGARHAVVSLWPVHDAVGALVMRDFYGHLRGGEPVGAALARAQRGIRGLSTENLLAEYSTMAARYGVPATADGLRDASPEHDTPPDPLHGWAPFIHVGGFW